MLQAEATVVGHVEHGVVVLRDVHSQLSHRPRLDGVRPNISARAMTVMLRVIMRVSPMVIMMAIAASTLGDVNEGEPCA